MHRCFRSSLRLSHPSNYLCSSCARYFVTAPPEPAPRQGSTRFKVSLDALPSLSPDVAQSTEYRQLLHLFGQPSHLSSPDDTWEAYSNLVRANLMDGSRIPFEVHQRALRRTLPIYAKSLGDAMSLKARKSRRTASLHGWCPYQYRIDAILEHIRNSGVPPHPEDYHLILLHHAVWGNIRGSLDLLRAFVTSGSSSPTERTYELVLYSFVRKLALVRHWEHTREDLLPLIEREFLIVMKDMKDRGIRQTRLIDDHCTRIVGAVSSRQSFDSMVAAVHGIDVKQPDAVPPHFTEQIPSAPEMSPTSEALRTERGPPPVSTATLNTLVRVLGSGPNRSMAMVGAFESLTSPIPPLRLKREAYGYEDGVDDDEPHYVLPTPFSIRRAQASRPNTQTYTYLIQNCIAMRNKTLAKHYLDLAISDEKSQEQEIRARIRNIMYNPLDGSVQITAEKVARLRREVPRATVGVNVHMFKAIYHYADEWGDGGLIKWVKESELAVIQEKKRSLALLAALSEAMDLVIAEQGSEGWAPRESRHQHSDPYGACYSGGFHTAKCNYDSNMPGTGYGAPFDHRAHIRVHTRNIADIRKHVDMTSDHLRQTEEHMSKAVESVKRLRERKIRKQANTFVTKELNLAAVGQSDPAAVARIREQYRRRWAATMSARNLRKLSEETLDDIDHSIFSALPSTDTHSYVAPVEQRDELEDAQRMLMHGEQREVVNELRGTVTSMPRNCSSTLFAALRVPLARDSQLHRYDSLPAAFASAFDVEDHHIYAPGVRKMRSKGGSTGKRVSGQKASKEPNNTPKDVESEGPVHTPCMT